MKSCKKIFYWIIVYSGIAFLFRFLLQRKRLTVLYYHSADAYSFAKQLAFLNRYYNVVDLFTVDLFLRGDFAVLPHYSVLITFDDGHASNVLLTDVVNTFKARPVIFLSAAYCSNDTPFWFKLNALNEYEKERLKTVSDRERRLVVEQQMAETNVQQSGFALSWDQIKEMQTAFNFQSHTLAHPCLPQCDEKVARTEIEESKKLIEEKTEKAVFAFAYPNGDYGAREIDMLAEAGYRMAFTGRQGFITGRSKPFELNRLSTNDTTDMNDFIVRICGCKAFLKRKLHLF